MKWTATGPVLSHGTARYHEIAAGDYLRQDYSSCLRDERHKPRSPHVTTTAGAMKAETRRRIAVLVAHLGTNGTCTARDAAKLWGCTLAATNTTIRTAQCRKVIEAERHGRVNHYGVSR